MPSTKGRLSAGGTDIGGWEVLVGRIGIDLPISTRDVSIPANFLLSVAVGDGRGIFAMHSVIHHVYEVFTSRRIIICDHDNLPQNRDAVA